jgi:hypothetical protein
MGIITSISHERITHALKDGSSSLDEIQLNDRLLHLTTRLKTHRLYISGVDGNMIMNGDWIRICMQKY